MEKLGPTHPLVTTTISSQWALWTSCICASFNSLSTKSFIYFLSTSFMENSRAIGIMTFPPSINWNSLLHTLCANDSLHKCYPLTSIWSNTTFLNLFHDMFMKNIQSFIKSLGLWIYRHINVGAHFCIVFQNNIHTIEHYMNEAFFWCVQCSCAIIQPRELVVQNNLQKYEQPQNQIPNYKNY